MRRAIPAALLLAGCASPDVRTERVLVPVPAECPAPPVLVRPALPIADLSPDSPPDAVLRAYAATVEALMGAVDERDALLNGYRP